MDLFKKKSKVKAGKSAQEPKEKKSLFASLEDSWKKLNSMDQKQAYTWGAVAVSLLVMLMVFASFASSSKEKEDFNDFDSRGYDLSRMPFSNDEAEAYLLASKYPDMQESVGEGLYSPEEKAERQAEDEEAAEQEEQDRSSTPVQRRYFGSQGSSYNSGKSSRSGKGTTTQVGKISNASVKGASGSGINSTFGAAGDFSNFKNQNKGKELNQNMPTNAGSGDAKKALQQMAQASRAAAGLKDGKLLNAKKAMMGGKVNGSDAFMADSGAVDLSKLEGKGLELDPNAPIGGADTSDLDNKINDAKQKSEKEKGKEEMKWWQQLLIELAKTLVQTGANMLSNYVGTNIKSNAEFNSWQKQQDYLQEHGRITTPSQPVAPRKKQQTWEA